MNLAFISECGAPIDFGEKFVYTLEKPSEKFVLDKDLAEVSGMSFINDNEVALIEDEQGSIFYYNFLNKTIHSQVSFTDRGDFEDIEFLGDSAYVLRSDGTIFEILNLDSTLSTVKAKIYDTPLSIDNDTEGLCYDKKRSMLLIGCKNKPGTGRGRNWHFHKRAIYGFDLKTKKLSAEPVLLIDETVVEKYAYASSRNGLEKLMSFYSLTQKIPFEPSGMSFHPITNDLYIISSASNLMVVVDPNGKITSAHKLSQKVFKQPEGIAFDTKGNMYISNEGRKGKGNILKFNYEL